MDLEQRITEMVKSEGLDPALWCWVGVDKDGDVYVFDKKPKLREGIYSGPPHCHVGQIETDEPQLFKFNPFADTEQPEESIQELKEQIEELTAWKEEAMRAMNLWDCQAVGELLGLRIGQSICENIEPAIRKLQSDLDAAKFHIRKLAHHLSAANHTYMHSDEVSEDIRAALKLTNQK